MNAKKISYCVVAAAWLAVFCLFGYRATFAVFSGPMAQVLLSLGVKPMLVENAAQWRDAMNYLSWIFLFLLLFASYLAKKNPDQYGLQPFGAPAVKAEKAADAKPEFVWKISWAFKTYPLWASIVCFMACVCGEFLIWTQIVRYWNKDLGMSLDVATNLYVVIGIAGIFTMPLLGMLSDKLVVVFNDEIKARKVMLVVGPLIGVIACVFLLMMNAQSLMLGVFVCILFAIYWAIVPGGVVGYCGAIYGQKSLGKIWGLATWIIMGIGPALGSFMGGYLADSTGNFTASIYFGMGSFVVAIAAALSMPRSVKMPER